MLKEIGKILISTIVFTICFQIFYTCSTSLSSKFTPLVKVEYNYLYKNPITQVLTYVNSEEYKLKKYIEKAIDYMEKEPRDPSTEQVDKYVYQFDQTNRMWCTEFVVWSLKQAEKDLNYGYLGSVYPYVASGYRASKFFEREDRLHMEKTYIPKRGDMMFFKYYDTIIDHTAFVLGVEVTDGETYVLTIEGNIPSYKDKGIKLRKLPLSDPYIYGYGSYE